MKELVGHLTRQMDRALFLSLNGDGYMGDNPRGKFETTCKFLGLIKDVFPEFAKKIQVIGGFSYDFGAVPIDRNRYHIETRIGSGGQNDVFLCKSKNPDDKSLVLKFDHIKGRDCMTLESLALQTRQECSYLRQAFSDLPDLFLPESYFICENPIRRKPCVVTVQPYLNHFTDYKDVSFANWKTLFKERPFLRDQLRLLGKHLSEWKRNDILPDILGRDNLVVNSSNLVFIDSLPTKPNDKSINRYKEEYNKALSHLNNIANLAE